MGFSYISVIFLYICHMFFLSASTNILIYFLVPAFFGIFFCIQEKIVPSEVLVADIKATEKTENANEWYVACEKKEEKIEYRHSDFIPEVKQLIYFSPHSPGIFSDFSFLRAPPVVFSEITLFV